MARGPRRYIGLLDNKVVWCVRVDASATGGYDDSIHDGEHLFSACYLWSQVEDTLRRSTQFHGRYQHGPFKEIADALEAVDLPEKPLSVGEVFERPLPGGSFSIVTSPYVSGWEIQQ